MDPGTLEEYNLPEADSGIFNGNDIGLTRMYCSYHVCTSVVLVTNCVAALDVERPPVPRLSFGLDRVLFKYV